MPAESRLPEFLEVCLRQFPISVVDVGCAGGIDPLWRDIAAPGLIRYFGFEPNPGQYQALKPRPDTRYFNLLVSDRAGEQDFFSFSTVGSVHRRAEREERFGEVYEKLRLPCDTLENMRQSATLPSLEVIKIDTEGHELAVLSGAGPFLAGETLMVKAEISFHRRDTENNFASIHAFMTERGFLLAGLSYNLGILGELYGGDVLYVRSIESLLAGEAAGRRTRILQAIALALWLRQYDYAGICIERAGEEGLISGQEKTALAATATARVFLPDFLPPISFALGQIFFVLSQLMTGRRHRSKSAPKQNRLVSSNRLAVSGKWWRKATRNRIAMLLKNYDPYRNAPN